jgi:hypothetical protein
MATSQLAYAAEKVIGHDEENIKQDVSNYQGTENQRVMMKALTWQGQNSVSIGNLNIITIKFTTLK